MEYLLYLQQLREQAPAFLNDGILFVSEFMGGSGALAVMALIYWCISKKAGSFLLLNFSSAYMMNQTLKNIFCVDRPFIRDERLHPYKPASGYSFPSGHTMLGTAIYSSIAVWLKQHAWITGLCIIMTLLTAFGRNWIGVHTPQDVIVGMLVSLAVVWCQSRILSYLEKQPSKDRMILILALAWASVLLLLIPGSGKVCGIFAGVYCGWFAERRWIRFEISGKYSRRVLSYLIGMALVVLLNKVLLPTLLAPIGGETKAFLLQALTFFFVSAGWPAAMKHFRL